MNKQHFLMNTMQQAAIDAGALILEHYHNIITVEYKADQSPVTAADRAAETIILQALEQAAPQIPIVAEERIANGNTPDALGERFFLVDPLDGTREFIARNGEFTVNIALIENGVPVMGVVYVPVSGALFSGVAMGKNTQALQYHVDCGQLTDGHSIHTRLMPQQPITVSSRSHRSRATQDWLDRHQLDNCISVGSSLKFCQLALGYADIYPRFENCMEWDTAAGDAVLRAAGGIVLGLDGKPLTYGKRAHKNRADFLQDFFIAYGDRKTDHAAFLRHS